CIGCDRYFTTYHGMILHVESNTCSSGIRLVDLNRLAAQLYQWHWFVDPLLRMDLLNGCNMRHELPFKCSGCGCWFRKLSSLFNHISSRRCDTDIDDYPVKKLTHWLEVGYYRS
ncbi:hypothetical protein BDY21DRAFT_293286, partial [Lineolata rhizophorae]